MLLDKNSLSFNYWEALESFTSWISSKPPFSIVMLSGDLSEDLLSEFDSVDISSKWETMGVVDHTFVVRNFGKITAFDYRDMTKKEASAQGSVVGNLMLYWKKESEDKGIRKRIVLLCNHTPDDNNSIVDFVRPWNNPLIDDMLDNVNVVFITE